MNKAYQNIIASSELFEKDKNYWLDKLQGDIVMSGLPVDYRCTEPKIHENTAVCFRFPDDVSRKIVSIAKGSEYGIYIILLSGVKYLLYRYTGNEDVFVGMPVFRQDTEAEYVNNILALRSNIRTEGSFGEILREVRNIVSEANEHQNFPYRKIAELLGIGSKDGTTPLFSTIVMSDNIHNRKDIEDIKAYTVFNFMVKKDCIELELEYNPGLFRKETIERVAGHLIGFFSAVTGNTGIKLSEIDILQEEERKKLLFGFNDTAAGYPTDMTINKIFEEIAEKMPDNTAVVLGDKKLTYGELNKKANQLATMLREKGVRPDNIIAIIMECSLEMIIAILGILKAGGAYLPIDPKYPVERIRYMLQDSGTDILLTQNTADQWIVNSEKPFTVIRLDDESIYTGDGLNLAPVNKPSDLAYIIYTSGTTGRPKGVMIEHRNVVRLLFNDRIQFDFNQNDVWTLFHSYCFDFSVWEMYGALLYGGKLVMVPRLTAREPREFLRLLKKEKVTVLNQTPTAFYSLANEETVLKEKELGIRYVIFGGEALKPVMLKEWKQKYPETELINMYGITETTVHVTYKRITEKEIELGISNIGKPIPTLAAYIVDKDMKPVPIGVPGELCIGGDGVGRGYLNRPELTAEKFVPNPFTNKDDSDNCQRMYRSGDLAKWLPDGDMEYLGRIDQQVKIRGHRIELGEIESRLLGHEAVKEAVVLTREDDRENRYICAYIVPERDMTAAELREHLAKELPEYMIPAYFIKLDKMPMTSNGKVDRKNLPGPDINMDTGEKYEAPGNDIEEKLVQIWQEVLKAEKVGVNDNFFVLGGDSIRAIDLINRVNRDLSTDIRMKDLYTNQTARELASLVENNVPAYEDELKIGLGIIEEMKQGILNDKAQASQLPEGWEDFYPLSRIQQGMVFYSQLKTEGPMYHDQFIYEAKFKDFDVSIYQEALKVLARKHPMLRTVFYTEKFSQAVQVVHGSLLPDVTVDKIQGLEKQEQEEHIRLYMKNDLENRFKFDGDLLWRVKLFKLGEEDYFIVVTIHHSILDGWSVALFNTELFKIYNALVRGEKPEAYEIKSSYKDYVAINLSRRMSDEAQEFWKEILKDYTRTRLPFNITNRKLKDITGSRKFMRHLHISLREALEEQAIKYGCTLKEICLSAYVYLISIITAEKDIVTGVVTHDRPTIQDADKIIGCFLNTVPLRVNVGNSIDKLHLLETIKQYLVKVKPHEIFLADIANIIGETNRSGNPIFDTIFNFIDFHVFKSSEALDTVLDEDCSLNLEPNEMTNTLFDLEVSKTLNRFDVWIKYSPAYFDEGEIETAFNLYVRILEKFSDGDCKVLRVEELITQEEKKGILYDFNNTMREYQRDKTMHRLFEEQAERAPGNIALIFEDKTMTYGELDKLSNRLARVLSQKGVKSCDHVGLITQRGFDMIIGMLSILKCGAAYVPIDPEYPAARKEYIASNSKISTMLVDGDYGIAFGNTVRIDHREMELYPDGRLVIEKDSRELAYIIYTSGSTGMPKGVMIEHHSAVNLIQWVNREFNVNENDALLFITSMCFDLSVYDIFGILAAGGRVVIAKKEQVQNPWELKELMKKEKVTFWDSVPTTMNYFVNTLEEDGEDYIHENLRLVFMSGDWIPVKLPNRLGRFFPNARVISLGGATEGTVWSIYYPVEKGAQYQASIPYGKPIDNNYFYILDNDMNIVPRGVAGELYIGGVGVAKGYINRPELTAERFVPDPFAENSQLMYRTGDLGRMMPDGNIEFLGRMDHQVKIRGFRVELGEIESHILKYEDIKEAVVVDRVDERGDKYLCAYITSGKETSAGALREYLSRELPNYMIPSYFIRMERIPLTPNGKVDKKALPEPETGVDTGVKYEAPRDGMEEKLAEVLRKVLGIKNIGINDNFFEIGGDSIKAMQVITSLKKQHLKLEIRDLLQKQTIKNLGGCVQPYVEKAKQEIVTGEIDLIPTQKGFFRKTRTDIDHWNLSIMLYKKDGFDEKITEKVFRKIVEHHDALRIVFNLDGERITQYNKGLEGEILEFRVMDCTADKDNTTRMDDEIYAINSSMDLRKGPLIKLELFRREDGDHLLLVIHHLVWDGLSMMLILEDFATGYRQAVKNEDIRLPDKTSSLKDWSKQLSIYANSKELLEEIKYWEQLERKTINPIPKDAVSSENRRRDDETMSVDLLSDKETKLLLNEVNQKYDTDVKDLLVTAFGAAMKEWTGESSILVDYKIHGREDIFKGIDVTRTVGWFGTEYPAIIDMSNAHDLSLQLQSIRDMFRGVPGKGLGYETLRDITLPENKKSLKFNLNPEILFNYFGDFDSIMSTIFEDFSMSTLNKAFNESSNSERKYTLIIELAIMMGKLHLTVHYNRHEYYESTIERLVESYRKNLLRLIDFCMKP